MASDTEPSQRYCDPFGTSGTTEVAKRLLSILSASLNLPLLEDVPELLEIETCQEDDCSTTKILCGILEAGVKTGIRLSEKLSYLAKVVMQYSPQCATCKEDAAAELLRAVLYTGEQL